MDFGYKLNDGQYVLYDGEDPIGPCLEEVAIALDKASGTLHKHGDPALVAKWFQHTQAKFRAAGFDDIADDLVVISGRFALEDLNRCISTSGYAGRLYQRLLAGEVVPEKSS